MITLTQINKTFRLEHIETKALNNISLTIEQGDFTAIVGPSGSGKSTLLNILGFIDSPSSGSFTFDRKEVGDLKTKQLLALRRQVSFIFQKFHLIEHLNIRENIRIPLLSMSMTKKQQNRRIDELAEKLGIGHRLNHKPHQLSGGQQQRAAITRALVNKPKLILADEPTGNLDSRNGNEIFDILKTLNDEGVTIAMVTHNMELAQSCKKQLCIQDGLIVDAA